MRLDWRADSRHLREIERQKEKENNDLPIADNCVTIKTIQSILFSL